MPTKANLAELTGRKLVGHDLEHANWRSLSADGLDSSQPPRRESRFLVAVANGARTTPDARSGSADGQNQQENAESHDDPAIGQPIKRISLLVGSSQNAMNSPMRESVGLSVSTGVVSARSVCRFPS
ncbi:MAG: hypothetical protein U0930_19530 [Pirellulales bacterium]